MTPASCAAVDGILSPPPEHRAGARLFAENTGVCISKSDQSSANRLSLRCGQQPNRDCAGADTGPTCPRRMISA